jgi:alkyl hydroperoxide reductase subunit AhpF
MALLKDKDREFLTKEFGKLTEPVKLVYFTQEHECPYCETTGQIVSEVAGLSDKITTAVYDFVADKALAGKYRVDKIPAIVVERGGDQPRDFGMRFYGIPSGYEFTSLIEAIKDASAGATALAAETKAALATITQPVHIQVFSTPT